MHFFAIYRKAGAALYAYFLQTKRGCLVYALFAGCDSVPGVRLVYALFLFPACCRVVRLVYALFGEIRNKYKKEGGKEGAVYVCTLWKKSVPPSVCTLWREKRSPAAGIASRRAERVSG